MRFAILGPLAVHDDSGARSVGTRKVQLLLALLLLEANRPVSAERIKLTLWGERPPGTVNASLYNHVAQLRRALAEQHASHASPELPRISTEDQAYCLRVEAGELDADEFTRHVEAARRAYLDQDWPSVTREAEGALTLWRGRPLAGLADALDGDGRLAGYSEARLQTLGWRFDAELALGRHHGLIPELTALAAEHPWHEGFHRQLMLALHRTGRQGEALAVHQQLRRTLAEDLGVEPGPDVQAAHREILAAPQAPPRQTASEPASVSSAARTTAPAPASTPASTSPSPPAGPSTGPAQLPPATPYFVGRADQLDALREHLTDTGEDLPLAVVSGMAGVGKSALAVYLGRQLAADFPDGRLYLNLRGSTAGATALTPAEALARLLTALGVDPQRIPDDPDAASALLRSTLHDTRTLLLLDDAASAAQVRPLLPAGPGCAVLVTSRSPLVTLDGTLRLSLAPLSDPEALALVGKVAGTTRVAEDEPAARQILHLCGRLPLALRVVAARLVASPALSLCTLSGQLADEAVRLDHLDYEDLSVRGPLALAHRALTESADPADRRAALLLRRVGAIALIDYQAPLAARLLDCPVAEAEKALARLAEVALLDQVQPGRYAPHDLVRDFARELSAREESDEDRAAAAERGVRWYAELAGRTTLALQPAVTGRERVLDGIEAFPDSASALAWYDQESGNLGTLIAHHLGDPATRPLTLTLIRELGPAMQHRGRRTAIEQLNALALTVARECGDRLAEAFALHDGAWPRFMAGDLEGALARTEQALALWRELGNRHLELAASNNRGTLLESLGRYAEAAEVIEQVLELNQDADDFTRAVALNNLGNLYEHTDPHKAIETHRRSLELSLTLNLPGYESAPHSNIGYAYLRLGQPEQALPHFEEALRTLREADGDWLTEYTAHLGYVRALRTLGALQRAREEGQQLIEASEAHDDTYAEGLARHEYGLVLRASGAEDQAVEQWRLALKALEGTDNTAVLTELRDLL